MLVKAGLRRSVLRLNSPRCMCGTDRGCSRSAGCSGPQHQQIAQNRIGVTLYLTMALSQACFAALWLMSLPYLLHCSPFTTTWGFAQVLAQCDRQWLLPLQSCNSKVPARIAGISHKSWWASFFAIGVVRGTAADQHAACFEHFAALPPRVPAGSCCSCSPCIRCRVLLLPIRTTQLCKHR
jgi:hypothetical protein